MSAGTSKRRQLWPGPRRLPADQEGPTKATAGWVLILLPGSGNCTGAVEEKRHAISIKNLENIYKSTSKKNKILCIWNTPAHSWKITVKKETRKYICEYTTNETKSKINNDKKQMNE